MKLICDFSFVSDYIENFFSDDNRDSATIVNSAIVQHFNGSNLLVISIQTIDELYRVYGDRWLVLGTILDICDKIDIPLCDGTENLIKTAAICEMDDKETYVLAQDTYIIMRINKTTHKAISIKQALEKLKEKNLLKEIIAPVTEAEEAE